MAHFMDLKKNVKTDVLASLEKTGTLDYEKTLAAFSLSTGLSERSIKKVLLQMNVLGYINIEGNTIKRPVSPNAEEVAR